MLRCLDELRDRLLPVTEQSSILGKIKHYLSVSQQLGSKAHKQVHGHVNTSTDPIGWGYVVRLEVVFRHTLLKSCSPRTALNNFMRRHVRENK